MGRKEYKKEVPVVSWKKLFEEYNFMFHLIIRRKSKKDHKQAVYLDQVVSKDIYYLACTKGLNRIYYYKIFVDFL